MKGADLDFAQPLESPCAECGERVGLTSIITVNVMNEDGTETTTEMTEADARALLMKVDIAPPLVMCERHVHLE